MKTKWTAHKGAMWYPYQTAVTYHTFGDCIIWKGHRPLGMLRFSKDLWHLERRNGEFGNWTELLSASSAQECMDYFEKH